MAHTPHSHQPAYDIVESFSGFWVCRIVNNQAQAIERFDELVDAERFIGFLALIASSPRRLAMH